MSGDRTPAEQACVYVMGRILRDPQIAYLMGPGTEAYQILTDVVGDLRGEGGEAYRTLVGRDLRTEAVVPRSMWEALRDERNA